MQTWLLTYQRWRSRFCEISYVHNLVTFDELQITKDKKQQTKDLFYRLSARSCPDNYKGSKAYELSSANRFFLVLNFQSSEVCAGCLSAMENPSSEVCAASLIMAKLRSYNLNSSQETTVLSCISMRECEHQNTVKLICNMGSSRKQEKQRQ